MSEQAFNEDDPVLAEWVDEVADQFEAAWQALTPPPLADFLGTATGLRRAALLAELHKIDRAYRRKLTAAGLATADMARGSNGQGHTVPGEGDSPPAGPAAAGPPHPPDPDWPEVPGYEICGELGRGGMGVVYQARQTKLQRFVALKMVPAGAGAGPRRRRLLTEARAAARLQHPNIVPIYEVGEYAGQPFFALEYLEGGTLAARLAGVPQPPRLAARLVETLARAIDFAHRRQIVHRDLKPHNVLLAGAPGMPLGLCAPKVSDFGLAKQMAGPAAGDAGGLAPTWQTQTGEILGTPSYMAPEQATGDPRLVGPAADVYALGAILYECLTGRPPFQGKGPLDVLEQVRTQEPVPPRRLAPGVPRDLETVCLKALAKAPARRYATAEGLADDLRRFQGGEPVRARPVRWPAKLWRWCRRNPAVASLTAVVFLLLVGLTAAFGWATVAAWGQEEEAQARAEEAQKREQEATARERDRRREGLVEKIRVLRTRDRSDGWSGKAWELVKEAAALQGRRRDSELQNEATATLSGLDVWNVKTFSSGKFYEHDCGSVAVAADGKRVLLGGCNLQDGRPVLPARLWDRNRDSVRPSRQVGAGPVAFRRDGTPLQVVPQSRPAHLLLWDVARQRPLGECRFAADPQAVRVLPGPMGLPVAAVSADGEVVAAAAVAPDGRGYVAAWEVASGTRLAQVAAAATALALSADGQALAVSDGRGRVGVWSLPQKRRLGTFAASRLAVHCLAFSPDGKLLACGGRGALTVWDWRGGRLLAHFLGSWHDVFALAFNPDGTVLASGGRYWVRFWDAASGRQLLAARHADFTMTLAFSADGQTFACGSVSGFGPGRADVWRVENGRGVHTLYGLSEAVSKVYFSRDGRSVAALADNWQAAVWDVRSGRLRGRLDVPAGVADNASLAISPDGRKLAFAAGREARQWEIATGQELDRWPLPPALQDALTFDPTGKRLLLFRQETEGGLLPPNGTDPRRYPRVCQFRDLLRKTWKTPLASSRAYNRNLNWAVASPDASRFFVLGAHAGGGERLQLRVFEAGTGKEAWALRTPGAVSSFAHDPLGKLLAVATQDGKCLLVEAATGRHLRWLAGRPFGVAPDGRHWGALEQGAVRGYSLRRWGHAGPLVVLGLNTRVTSHFSQFSADGRLLLWGNADGGVSLCDLEQVRRRLSEVGLGW